MPKALLKFSVGNTFSMKWKHQASLELLKVSGKALFSEFRAEAVEIWSNKIPETQKKVFLIHRRQPLKRSKIF